MKLSRKQKWFGGGAIGIVFLVAALIWLTYLGNAVSCEARWAETNLVARYSPMAGCLVEYPAKTSTMVPEASIRLNEPSKPPTPEVPQ